MKLILLSSFGTKNQQQLINSMLGLWGSDRLLAAALNAGKSSPRVGWKCLFIPYCGSVCPKFCCLLLVDVIGEIYEKGTITDQRYSFQLHWRSALMHKDRELSHKLLDFSVRIFIYECKLCGKDVTRPHHGWFYLLWVFMIDFFLYQKVLNNLQEFNTTLLLTGGGLKQGWAAQLHQVCS